LEELDKRQARREDLHFAMILSIKTSKGEDNARWVGGGHFKAQDITVFPARQEKKEKSSK
jgi:hypothetical protein